MNSKTFNGLFQGRRFRIKDHEAVPRRIMGAVQPCCSFFGYGRHIVGNVSAQSIDDIWNGGECRTLRRIMREGRLTDNPICRECAATWDTGEIASPEEARP
jgi:MoaA/NifB/PqqE/SkfB family radical SAM enzyme